MSLINCTECGKEISDRAATCPNCGFPIAFDKIQRVANSTIQRAKSFSSARINLTTFQANELINRLGAPSAPWSLRRINGVGVRIGALHQIYEENLPTKYALGYLIFSVFFVPIIPLGFRMVEPTDDGYKFIGNLKHKDIQEIIGENISIKIAAKTFIESAIFILIIVAAIFIVAIFMQFLRNNF